VGYDKRRSDPEERISRQKEDAGKPTYNGGTIANKSLVRGAQTVSRIGWTDIQFKRLKELGADPETMSTSFDTNEERNRSYQTLEKKLVKRDKARLNEFLTSQLQT